MTHAGVTFIVPVYDGARTLEATLASILAQDAGRPIEVVAVDDGSRDRSPDVLARFAREAGVRVLAGDGRGAAAAINRALADARHPLIAQVDQDVTLAPGWLARLAAAVEEPGVGAAQGRYVPSDDDTLFARVMALDLVDRYDELPEGRTTTCAPATRFTAPTPRAVGGLDESLGYGYDNDLSYRLSEAGWRSGSRRTRRAATVARGLRATCASSTASATAGSTSSRGTLRASTATRCRAPR